MDSLHAYGNWCYGWFMEYRLVFYLSCTFSDLSLTLFFLYFFLVFIFIFILFVHSHASLGVVLVSTMVVHLRLGMLDVNGIGSDAFSCYYSRFSIKMRTHFPIVMFIGAFPAFAYSSRIRLLSLSTYARNPSA